jgi:hypothetical protein
MFHTFRISVPQGRPLRWLAVLCGLWCSQACAVTVTLAWDADNETNIAGYQVQYGPASGDYTQVSDVGNTTTSTLTGLEPGHSYYFVVRAYNTSGVESVPSNEVKFQTGPLAVNDTAFLLSATPVVINVLANDKCPSGTPTVSGISQPRFGAAVINGDNTITYTPGDDFAGHDSLTYTLSDGEGGTSTASVAIIDKGTFAGLVTNGSPTAGNTGRIRVEVTAPGEFTGRLTLGTLSAPITGVFSADGSATIDVEMNGEPAMSLTLNLNTATAKITGSIAGAAEAPSAIAASFATYSMSNVAPETGAYTVLLPPDTNPSTGNNPPQGTGFGRLVVSANGNATLIGKLADGTVLNTSAPLGADGTVSIYAPLYAGKGFLSGVLKFETVTTPGSESDLDGALEWQKPETAGRSGTLFPAGFDTTIDAIGSTYTVAVNELTAEAMWTGQKMQATVTLSGGNFWSPIVDDTSLIGRALLKETGSDKDRLTIQFNRVTGLFAGSFLDSTTNSNRKLAGAVFQKRALGAGFFCTQTLSGSVLLTNGVTIVP